MALAIGMTEEQFWNSNPRRLKMIYVNAYSKKLDMIDELLWTMGGYVHSAVTSAIDIAFNGKKSTVKYIEQPIRKQVNSNNSSNGNSSNGNTLTEEEKLRQVEAIFMSLDIRKHNFDMQKKLKERNESKTTITTDTTTKDNLDPK